MYAEFFIEGGSNGKRSKITAFLKKKNHGNNCVDLPYCCLALFKIVSLFLKVYLLILIRG